MATASKPKSVEAVEAIEAVEAVEAVPMVTNNYTGMLNIGGVDIAPGKSAVVSDWATVKQNATVAVWLQAGVISE